MKTRCPECGTKLELVEGGLTPGESRAPHGQKAPDFLHLAAACPNPDCPGNDSDMAKATGPDGAQS